MDFRRILGGGSALFFGFLLCITIIGILFGKQHFKLIEISLMPFGKADCGEGRRQNNCAEFNKTCFFNENRVQDVILSIMGNTPLRITMSKIKKSNTGKIELMAN